jgi:mRNA interferase MazF
VYWVVVEDVNQEAATRQNMGTGTVNRGDVFWLVAEEAGEFGQAHPHVVVQDDVFNHSRIKTIVVCGVTSNIHRASEPGNVLLEPGEGGVSRQSVVVVSQISSVEKNRLGDYLGTLTSQRVEEILAGLRFQQASFFSR